jgi:hypothetical protein
MRVCSAELTILAGDWIDVRLRMIGAGALAVLAVTGLTACQTKAGAAAVVDGHRIDQSDVNKYVDEGFTAPTPTGTAQAQEPARVIVLNTLIESRLMTALLARSLGGVPSEADLNKLHDEAFAVQLNLQQPGAQADQALDSALTKSGLKASFGDVFVRGLELKQAVIDKTKAQRQSDIANALKKLGIPVSVNARYGSWSADSGSLVDVKPDYLTLGTPTPSSAPSPG